MWGTTPGRFLCVHCWFPDQHASDPYERWLSMYSFGWVCTRTSAERGRWLSTSTEPPRSSAEGRSDRGGRWDGRWTWWRGSGGVWWCLFLNGRERYTQMGGKMTATRNSSMSFHSSHLITWVRQTRFFVFFFQLYLLNSVLLTSLISHLHAELLYTIYTWLWSWLPLRLFKT